jgi:hypothetical protein
MIDWTTKAGQGLMPISKAVHTLPQAHKTAPRCTRLHKFRAAAVFYPFFYPKRQRSGVEELFLLVTVISWSGRSEFVTSFPS